MHNWLKYNWYVCLALICISIGVYYIIRSNDHDAVKKAASDERNHEHVAVVYTDSVQDLSIVHDDKRGVTCYQHWKGGIACFLDDEMQMSHENNSTMKKWIDENTKQGAGH